MGTARTSGASAGESAAASSGTRERSRAGRRTQQERRARSREALLEAAARGLSRGGFGNLNLADVARDAGYTRGALYHQFKGKEDLALAVMDWVDESWRAEVGALVEEQTDPLGALLALARGHAIYCRRDVARVSIALRLEFSDEDHPLARRMAVIQGSLVRRCERLIKAARRDGSIPPGPPARVVALAFAGAMEGAVIGLAGHPRYDEELVVGAAAGVLGLDPERAWRIAGAER